MLVQLALFGVVSRTVVTLAIGRAHLARGVLSQTPPSERDAAAARMSDADYRIGREPPPDVTAAMVDPDPARGAMLGPLATVRVGGDAVAQVMISAPIDGQTWWFAQSLATPPGLPWFLLGLLALLAAVASAGALFGVRVLGRPLQALACEIGERQTTLRKIDVQPRDSTELRRIKQAFNALVDGVVLANRTRQQLLAGVSHDLRTPMSRLRLRIETQVDPAVSDELLYDLHGLERIVSQFLAYVHGQSHREAGVMAPLRAVVEQVVNQFGGPHVRAELDACAHTVPDLAVQRLLDNLIDNALAHGAGPVTVRLAHNAQGCVLTVFDHGPGLSAAEFEQALQPFVRLEASRPAEGHCGLGLAIVAQVAAQLGASLRVTRDTALGFGIAVRWPGVASPDNTM
jgi:two-component system, OmpR family, osmolarity sensor histidine kinase EnvZ